MGWVNLQVGLDWTGLGRNFPPFGELVGSWVSIGRLQKNKASYLLSIWLVTELCPSVMRIPVTLFEALACTCFLHLHRAALVSNY